MSIFLTVYKFYNIMRINWSLTRFNQTDIAFIEKFLVRFYQFCDLNLFDRWELNLENDTSSIYFKILLIFNSRHPYSAHGKENPRTLKRLKRPCVTVPCVTRWPLLEPMKAKKKLLQHPNHSSLPITRTRTNHFMKNHPLLVKHLQD